MTKGKGKEDPKASKAKSVEDSSTKGEKKQGKLKLQLLKKIRDQVKGRDKGKGKQVMQSSDEDYYYQGEQDDFDAFQHPRRRARRARRALWCK